MNESINVLIAIQARTNSTRFPGKIFQMLGNKTVLDHVIDGCKKSESYINKHTFKTRVAAKVCLVVPDGDGIREKLNRPISVVYGSELDVLSRYKAAFDVFRPDYIVRITADCPLIPPYIITKHIKVATVNRYDYLSNVDETSRTVADGFDCEIMSAMALKWLHDNAKDAHDREHVTTLIRRKPDKALRISQFIGFFDQSDLKLSIDTPEDLERVRQQYSTICKKVEQATMLLGQSAVHRI